MDFFRPPDKQDDPFKLTPEENERFQKAMKDPKFMELLAEYAKEIEDPKNREEQEAYLRQLEKEYSEDPGSTRQIIIPEPGFVIKTFQTKDNKKIFINVCSSDKVEESSIAKDKKDKDGRQGWNIPLSLGPAKDDKDKGGKECVVYDIVFHPNTLRMAQTSPHFHKFICDLALDYVCEKYKEPVKRDYVVLHNVKYKGDQVTAQVARKKPNPNYLEVPKGAPLPNDGGSELPPLLPQKQKPSPAPSTATFSSAKQQTSPSPLIQELTPTQPQNEETPKPERPVYKIVHKGEFDMAEFFSMTGSQNPWSTARRLPKELEVRIELPLLDSIGTVELDVTEKRLTLAETKQRYALDIALPYFVDEDRTKAKFDKAARVLIVSLPVHFEKESKKPLPQLPARPEPPVEKDEEPETKPSPAAATILEPPKEQPEEPQPEEKPLVSVLSDRPASPPPKPEEPSPPQRRRRSVSFAREVKEASEPSPAPLLPPLPSSVPKGGESSSVYAIEETDFSAPATAPAQASAGAGTQGLPLKNKLIFELD